MGSTKWLTSAVMGLVALLATTLVAQQPPPPPGAVEKTAENQARLLAKRAAMADCYRNLAEQVKGLRISSTTFVKDFVAESDQIETAVRTFLRGAKMVGQPRYMEDNSCEVTMELALSIVETKLTSIYKGYWNAGSCKLFQPEKYKISDFQDLHVTNKIEKVTATGNGTPRAIAVEEMDPMTGQPMPGRALALPPEWKGVSAQARLLGKRAAQVDAYRNLAEQVKGLHLTSSTYVKDFVAENDQIQTDLNTFLKGAKVVEVRYLRDLTVEVDVRIALETLVTELTHEYEARYKGDKYHIRDFQDMKVTNKIDYVTGTGTGLPRFDRPVGPGPVVVAPPSVPDWVKNTIKATGNGVRPADMEEPQAKLMAIRAAKLDAMRNATEQIKGLKIDSTTTVKDFVTQDDRINTEINTYLVGVATKSQEYNPTSGEATVVIEVPLEPVWNVVLKYRKELTIRSGPGGTSVERNEELRVRTPAP